MQLKLIESKVTLEILCSFLRTWQAQFGLAQNGLNTMTPNLRQKIVQYMTEYKHHQDKKDMGCNTDKEKKQKEKNEESGSAAERNQDKKCKGGCGGAVFAFLARFIMKAMIGQNVTSICDLITII